MDVTIVIPETKLPKDIIKHVTGCYQSIRKERVLYAESLTESLLDDYEQTLVQLLYRLKRLS